VTVKTVLSPRVRLLIFVMLVGFLFFFLLDFVSIHLPYTAKYLASAIAIVLYVILVRILKFRAKTGVDGES